MRYRRRKKRIDPRQFFRALCSLGLAGVCVAVLIGHRSLLEEAGRRMAIFTAAVTMPDASVEILRERFQAEIYGGDEVGGELHDSRPVPDLPQPPAESDNAGDGQQPDNVTGTTRAPRIPSEYAAPLISEDYSGTSGGTLVEYGAGYIRNDTNYDNDDVEEILDTEPSIVFAPGGEPQVLIVHTHATEAFEGYDTDRYDIRNTWRSTDNRNNMVAVGDVMAEILESYGIGVLHDTTQHDYPSYNGSYERSAETVGAYLEEYPGIKIVLDLHRDAMQRDDAIIKPIAVIDGKKAAQIMIISGCDDGTMDMPDWRENLRFAAALQDYITREHPSLMRPIFFCYRKYNMDLTPGSLLLEFGSNANTLEEAMYSAELAGHALAEFILDHTDASGTGTQDE